MDWGNRRRGSRLYWRNCRSFGANSLVWGHYCIEQEIEVGDGGWGSVS